MVGAGFYFRFGLCCKCRRTLEAGHGTAAVVRASGTKEQHPAPCWNGRQDPYQAAYLTSFCKVLLCQSQTSNL